MLVHRAADQARLVARIAQHARQRRRRIPLHEAVVADHPVRLRALA
jgi:hypothetical protein